MKQQQLTDLAMRKIYRAEQPGLDATMVQQMRDGVRDLNEKVDHAAQYVGSDAHMLNSNEKVFLLDRQWNEFVIAMAEVGRIMSEWIRVRVKSPGGFKEVRV